MAICSIYQTQESMNFRDFMEYADNNVDFTKQDELLALGEQLTMLGNDRHFLTEFMADYIEKYLDAQEVPGTISQAAEMGRTIKFYVRFAVWMPEAGLRPQESVLYAYNQAHDHNFDLLTLGYCGSGYYTDVYEYDYNKVAGYIGEQVELKPLGSHQHKTGEVLLYRCSKDIHFQRPPDTPSITLNVIPLHNQNELIDQYFFDIQSRWSENGVIARHADSNIELRNSLYSIVSHFASPKIVRLLSDVVDSSCCQRSRYEALRALRNCDPDAHRLFCDKLRGDKSLIIKEYCRGFDI